MQSISRTEEKHNMYRERWSFFLIVLVSSLLKILLIPAYKSTDFEVHRNWLAITFSLPINKWYFEHTSEWTLDYPPFFAWFEKILSMFAFLVDPEIVKLDNLNYNAPSVIYFQRGTVILSDLLLNYGALKCTKSFQSLSSAKPLCDISNVKLVFLILISFNCGLYMVDHIHFQYNGFLFGMLLLSFANLMDGNIKWASFWFSVLLNFKHIFMYIAPAYGIYLLRTFCMNKSKPLLSAILSINVKKLLQLAFIVVSVFIISFGPFYDHLDQILRRLFPFKRGLTHAYWAPNFWALYNFADKVLYVLDKKMQFGISGNITHSSSSGLVQSLDHAVLPSILPIFTFIITVLSMGPCLVMLILYPCKLHKESVIQFLRTVTLCSLCSFMFGWHVHEKAILMAIIPYTLVAVQGSNVDAKIFLILQTVGYYSLFPLLFKPFETVIKILLLFIYSIFSFSAFSIWFSKPLTNGHSSIPTLPLLNKYESVYIYLLILNEFYCYAIHPLYFAEKLQFLPLMLTSVSCSFGIIWCWFLLYKQALFGSEAKEKSQKIT